MGPGEHRQKLLGVKVWCSELDISAYPCGLERVGLVGHLRNLVNLVDLWPIIRSYDEGQRFQIQGTLVGIAKQDLFTSDKVRKVTLIITGRERITHVAREMSSKALPRSRFVD